MPPVVPMYVDTTPVPSVTMTPQCLLGGGITLAPAATALFGSAAAAAAAAVTSGGADAAPTLCYSSASTTQAMAEDIPGEGLGVLPKHASEVAEPEKRCQQGAKRRVKKNGRRRKAKAKTGSGGMPE
jgi:hypothetical protein